jgi:hypothetical protein
MCVRLPGTIGVRDSKNPNGAHLSVASDAFVSLVEKIKRDEPNG